MAKNNRTICNLTCLPMILSLSFLCVLYDSLVYRQIYSNFHFSVVFSSGPNSEMPPDTSGPMFSISGPFLIISSMHVVRPKNSKSMHIDFINIVDWPVRVRSTQTTVDVLISPFFLFLILNLKKCTRNFSWTDFFFIVIRAQNLQKEGASVKEYKMKSQSWYQSYSTKQKRKGADPAIKII